MEIVRLSYEEKLKDALKDHVIDSKEAEKLEKF